MADGGRAEAEGRELEAVWKLKREMADLIRTRNPFSKEGPVESKKVIEFHGLLKRWLLLDVREQDCWERIGDPDTAKMLEALLAEEGKKR